MTGDVNGRPRLILGSASPRRLELLATIGVVPDEIRPPEIDETPLEDELARPYCKRMSHEKAVAIDAGPDDLVLCADTAVVVGKRILGKPKDAEEAAEFLRALSGRSHRVVTSVAVRRGQLLWQKSVSTKVKMNELSDQTVDAYIATNDWSGKAGGYGIQGPASAFIPTISGSYSGIVGLPLAQTADLLRAAGYDL